MNRTAAKTARSKRKKRGRRPHNDACLMCGSIMLERCGTRVALVHEDRIAVPNVTDMRCPTCHDGMTDLAELIRKERLAREIYSTKHGLLSHEGVKQVRVELKLTQAESAKLLHSDERTILHWEQGKKVQSYATDMILRMMRDVPGALEYVRRSTLAR